MIDFYYSLAPNPKKVALCLEEMGLPYRPLVVDTKRGEQFSPEYTALNPNNKVPCIVDGDAVVFDSNAILLYLAEKTGLFLTPDDPKSRGELLSWLMFVATGVGPYFGQSVHFRHWAPEPKDYAETRYLFEARRHLGIVDARLADREHLVGETYTIVDMALWGWARLAPHVVGDEAWDDFPNVKRFVDRIGARPAAQRAEALGTGQFKMETDNEARRFLYRHAVAG